MKIKEIGISGFRSIGELSLNINSHLQVYVGKNDVGKSNILKALDLFFNETIDNEPLIWERDFNQIYYRARGKNKPNHISIMITFELPDGYSNANAYAELQNKLSKAFSIEKHFYAKRTDLLFGCLGKRRKIVSEKDEIYKYVMRFISYIHFLYVPINKDENWMKESYIFSDIKSRFIDAWGKGRRAQQNISKLNERIVDLLDKLKKAVDAGMEDVTQEFKKLFPDYVKVTFKTPKDPEELLRLSDIEVTSQNNISTILGLRGSGVQSASIPLLLYYVDNAKQAKARKSLYFPIWAIEEPESFQHDELNSNISDFIFKLPDYIKVFITTHSMFYIRSDFTDAVNLIIKNQGGYTELSDSKSDFNAYFDMIYKELGADKTSIEIFQVLKKNNDKKFIVFEGRYDIDVFKKVLLLNDNLNVKFHDYEQINGNGSEIVKKVELLGRSGNEIIVIVDNDEDGHRYKQNIDKYKYKNVVVYPYDSKTDNDCTLESMFSKKIMDGFKSIMPQNALDHWFNTNQCYLFDQKFNGKYRIAPEGWDENGFKKKLVEYFNDYATGDDLMAFIGFYNSIL